MPANAIYDYTQFDFDNPLYTIEDIREFNRQRHEMEHLTGVVYVNRDEHGLVGYKDVGDDEFWVRGHMPEYPLMPGVIQCEAAAQLAGFYARKYDILEAGDFIGFGGLNSVRFRRPVKPNSRLVLCARVVKYKVKRLAEFEFQGFVDDKLVLNGNMIGVPIKKV